MFFLRLTLLGISLLALFSGPAIADKDAAGSPEGVVTLPRGRRKTFQHVLRSSCSGRRLPSPHSFAAKLAKRLARNQVSLDVEGVVDGGVYCKKSLSGTG